MRKVLAALIVSIPLFALTTAAIAEQITIAAAASLKEALVDINVIYAKETKEEVVFSTGASGQLLTQIKNGAPVDGFISAAAEQVDALEKEKLSVDGSRRTVAGNELVLIVPAASQLRLTSIADLSNDAVKKIAIGQPKSVPAGVYATQTLAHLKLDTAVAGKLVNGANVRQVLDYVEHGEVDAGFVYGSDAQLAGAKVKVIATAPADSHEPIVYPAVVIAASKKQEAARKFLDFLGTPKAQRILQNRGFTLPNSTTKPAN